MALTVSKTVRDPAIAKRVIAQQLDIILIDKAPVPSLLNVNGRAIPIFDLQSAIADFRDQTELLRRFNSAWPAVLLNFGEGSAIGEALVPLDLKNVDPDISSEKLEKYLSFRSLHGPLINTVQQAGLDARERNRDDVVRSFKTMLAEIIYARAAASRPTTFEPPAATVTVTSNSPHEDILFSHCYFINTWQVFGVAPAATAPLFWGHYIFGIERNGRPVFSDKVQTVPTASAIDLNL
jgi:hypothetical protein